jgi:hypothetical protein
MLASTVWKLIFIELWFFSGNSMELGNTMNQSIIKILGNSTTISILFLNFDATKFPINQLAIRAKYLIYNQPDSFPENCSDSMEISRNSNFQKHWFRNEDFGHLIFTDYSNLKSVMNCLTSPGGKYLMIINETSNKINLEEELLELFQDTWKSRGVLSIYIAILKKIYYYSPFEKNPDGSYGSLQFSQNFPTDQRNLKNLNGYSLNVEVFKGTMTYGTYKKDGTKLQDIYGPDIEVLKFLSKSMNFKSKLLKLKTIRKECAIVNPKPLKFKS